MDFIKSIAEFAANHRKRTGRPFVTLSYAQSLDGCISGRPGEALALKLAGLQAVRIGRVLEELGPGGREVARRFLAGMIGDEDRERVLRMIARAERARANGRD